MKTALMETHSAGAWDGILYAWVDLDEGCQALIARLSRGAKDLGVYQVSTFHTGLTWGNLEEVPEFIRDGGFRWLLGPRERDLMLIEFRPERVYGVMLNVRYDGTFFWSARILPSNVWRNTASLSFRWVNQEEQVA